MLSAFYYYFIISLPIALEGFPVSSSGHVLLFTNFFQYFYSFSPYLVFSDSLDHILHGPIAVILICFFYKQWIAYLKQHGQYMSVIFQLCFFVGITTGITAIGYFFFHGITMHTFPLYYGYLLTSIALFSLVRCSSESTTILKPFNACMLGLAQAIALLPGVSRFGFTFVVARWLGFSARRAFQFSFLIELPISIAGFAKGLQSVWVDSQISHLLHLKFLCTMLIASCLGLYGFYIVQKIVQQNRLWWFGYYTAFLAVISWMIQ